MQLDGWSIYYVPTTTVVHHRGATTVVVNRDFSRLTEMYYNVFWYFKKYYGSTAVVVYRLLLILGFVPRLLLWSVRCIADDTVYARHMKTYSAKVLKFGLLFWVPISRYRPDPEAR
jgi:GT2 family glycosyltransferase